MRFYSRCEAYDYWESAYYLSGGGYEGTGVNWEGRQEMFDNWVQDTDVSWLDDEDRLFIETF